MIILRKTKHFKGVVEPGYYPPTKLSVSSYFFSHFIYNKLFNILLLLIPTFKVNPPVTIRKNNDTVKSQIVDGLSLYWGWKFSIRLRIV